MNTQTEKLASDTSALTSGSILNFQWSDKDVDGLIFEGDTLVFDLKEEAVGMLAINKRDAKRIAEYFGVI